MSLTEAQQAIVDAPLGDRIFLRGPAGSGKTTVGVARLVRLLSEGRPGASILVLTPQRTLHEVYRRAAHSPDFPFGTEVATATIGGLARRVCDLFWPLVADSAGFAHPERPPYFLTLETSQYYMSHLVRPLLDRGYFQSVTMDRNRLYSQILDSLNKAAAVGFPHTEIGERLDAAWEGEAAQRRIYAEAQDCANRFRTFCLEHSLLDFSLQLEVFLHHLWPNPKVRQYFRSNYRHLIYDNVEEDVPGTHDLIRELLPEMDSALLIYDEDAGFRRFLGADTETGSALQDLCRVRASLVSSFIMSAALQQLEVAVSAAIRHPESASTTSRISVSAGTANGAFEVISSRYYPELLDLIAERIHSLLQDGRALPSDVAIVSPYLSDVLCFGILERLTARGIPARSHRPSRALRDEPAARTLLTLAAIAHPHWRIPPPSFDVERAFAGALAMDLIRAHLLTEIVVRKDMTLTPFESINDEMRERITNVYGERYMRLRQWLIAYRSRAPQPLDYFLRRLFGEVLSQPGFGFHSCMEEARLAGILIESVRKFRLAMEPSFVDMDHPDFDAGREYVMLFMEGVLAAQYLESWLPHVDGSVLVAPVHAFLMMNKPASLQFWIDPGSSGWFERLDQPLTHTRVLSRSWTPGAQWTFTDEEGANLDEMSKRVTGLIRRCREKIFLCVSQLGESGFEQRGRLLLVLNQVLHEIKSIAPS